MQISFFQDFPRKLYIHSLNERESWKFPCIRRRALCNSLFSYRKKGSKKFEPSVKVKKKKLETERCCATIEDRFLICINSMQISFMTATLDGQRWSPQIAFSTQLWRGLLGSWQGLITGSRGCILSWEPFFFSLVGVFEGVQGCWHLESAAMQGLLLHAVLIVTS